MVTTVLGTILLFILVLTAALYPRRVAMCLPLFFPLALIRVSFLLPFSFLEIVSFSLFLGYVWRELLWSSERAQHIRQSIALWKFPPVTGALLFGAACTLSLLWTPREILFNTGIPDALWETYTPLIDALGIWKGWIIPSIIFVFVVSYYARGEQRSEMAQGLRLSYVLSATLLALLGILLQYVFGLTTTLDGRFGGIFVSANYMVFFIAPALFLSLGDVLQRLRKKDLLFWLYTLTTFVLVIALVLTRSYGAWISTGIILAVWLYLLMNVKQRVGLALLVVLAGGIFYVIEKDTDKFTAFTELQEQSSTSTRVEVYTISLDILKSHWLTGVGMASYEPLYKVRAVEVLGKQPYEWIMLHPHNLYLSWWLFTGVGGLLVMVILLMVTCIHLLRTRSDVLAPLAYVMLHGFVDTPFWKLDAMMVFFLLIALSWLYTRTQR